MSARYTRLEQEADDDSVALIMGQPPPRLAQFGATNYVELDNLDSNGNATEEARQDEIHRKLAQSVRQSSKNLVFIIIGVAFTLVAAGVVASIHHRSSQHPADFYRPVLAAPLDRSAVLHNGTHKFRRSTLMISLDGMHPHYVSESRTPYLHNLTRSGFAPPYMLPAFPSQTFPNHWTLVTGMYPVNHGIVGNTFYDPELDLEFVNTDPEKSYDRRYWGGEPIWMTAKKNKLQTAVHMWPGSEADWGLDAPEEVTKFNRSEPLDEKASHILEWLDRGTSMPQVMLAYVPNIDTVGHKAGISGSALEKELGRVDGFIQTIGEALRQRNLSDIVNLVIVSDHGMAPTSNDRLVFLDDIVSNYDDVTTNRGWPLAGLRFNKTRDVDIAYRSASKAARKPENNGFKVYKSDSTPSDWHFTTGKLVKEGQMMKRHDDDSDDDDDDDEGDENDDEDGNGKKKDRPVYGRFRHRLAPMYIVPEVGYSLLTHEQWDNMSHDYFLKGVHGYNRTEPLMRALFLAQGPAFPSGHFSPFDNIDVYCAICRSVGMNPSAISDGDFLGRRMASALPFPENYPGVNFELDVMENSSFSKYFKVR